MDLFGENIHSKKTPKAKPKEKRLVNPLVDIKIPSRSKDIPKVITKKMDGKLERYNAILSLLVKQKKLIKEYGEPVEPFAIGHENCINENATNLMKEMESEIIACRKCPLGDNRIKRGCKPVPGSGEWKYRFMIVGEGPGATEETTSEKGGNPRLGSPFVGKSGQLLDKILAYIGLSRCDVFMTNAVKCRATIKNGRKYDDRPPMPYELKACMPYLHKQIGILKPWLIITFGKQAASTVLRLPLDLDDHSKYRDTMFDYPDDTNIKVWPTYHPAYLLRNTNDWIMTAERLKPLKVSIANLKRKVKNGK